MSHYIHNTPGRLRLKIPSLKRNIHEINELTLLLKQRPGIQFFDVNSITGSVTINYDQHCTSVSKLLELLSQEGYVDLAKLVPSHQHMDRIFSRVGETASKALLNIAVDRVLQGSPLSMIAAFI